MDKPTLIVITGPTASGKSALAVEVARQLHTDIISADSRQVFRGIPITTAVPTEEERRGVTHHLLEAIPLEEYYSASLFEEQSLGLLASILPEKGSAVVCGGSMMYIDALCNGLDELPTVPDSIRNGLMAEWNEKGDEWLLGRLEELDPAHLRKVDTGNLKRVFHAVEISITAGVPYSSLLGKKQTSRPFRIVKFCLTGCRDDLFRRINGRVDQMVASGMEEEARSVWPRRHLNSLNTVGFKEMFAYFEGTMQRTEAIERIKKNTRVYAKKQLTWHKRDSQLLYLDFNDSIIHNCNVISKS